MVMNDGKAPAQATAEQVNKEEENARLARFSPEDEAASNPPTQPFALPKRTNAD